jgi:DNA-binding winged helix-turn-helix (wHTH) protein
MAVTEGFALQLHGAVTSEGRVRFGEFELDERALVLRRRGEPVPLRPKPFALLVHLLRNR